MCMSNRWYLEKKREHYYRAAKQSGYRARSAYKLKQIQKKFSLIHKGDCVVDLGAAPGGWSQVAVELVGESGKVVGIDLLAIRPVDGAVFIEADMTEPQTLEHLEEQLAGRLVDVVLSDMSPDISGTYSMDQARSVWLCQNALATAKKMLKKNGHFVCKIFEGEDSLEFIAELKKNFNFVRRFSPEASRKSSSEIYLVAKSFTQEPK